MKQDMTPLGVLKKKKRVGWSWTQFHDKKIPTKAFEQKKNIGLAKRNFERKES